MDKQFWAYLFFGVLATSIITCIEHPLQSSSYLMRHERILFFTCIMFLLSAFQNYFFMIFSTELIGVTLVRAYIKACSMPTKHCTLIELNHMHTLIENASRTINVLDPKDSDYSMRQTRIEPRSDCM